MLKKSPKYISAPLRCVFVGLFFLGLSLGVAQGAEGSEIVVPEAAQAEGALDRGEPRVRTRLLVDVEAVAPGDTMRAGVLFDISPDWHIYWRSSGQGGMATEVAFQARAQAEDLSVGPVQWPMPTVYREAGGEIITFGYSTETLLFANLTVPTEATESIEITATVDYLVCKVDCIPGRATLTRAVPIAEERVAAPFPIIPLFDHYRTQVPLTPDAHGIKADIRYSRLAIGPRDTFRATIDVFGCDEKDAACLQAGELPEAAVEGFVFDPVPKIRLDVIDVREHATAPLSWTIELEGRANPDRSQGDARLTGVIRLRDVRGEFRGVEVDFALPRTPMNTRASETAGAADITADRDAVPDDTLAEATTASQTPVRHLPPSLAWWQILLFAFLGGLLLNLMPCVFPVLAVKVFSFINVVHEDRRNIYMHAAAYTGGIVGSLLLLAGAVIALQVLGTQVGWGFQFQEPWFIAVVGAVLVLFALNLFGVFQVGVPVGQLGQVAHSAGGLKRSFGEGVLAVVLATPCSAPFLGTAVGFALASGPATIVLVFATLGLGLAAPFVVLTLVPGMARRLPRPGAWMEHVKHGLGFALLGTVVWLLWLIGQVYGVAGITGLVIFLLAASLAAWLFGLVQYRPAALKWPVTALAVGIIVATGYLSLNFEPTTAAPQPTEADLALNWQPFDDDAISQELAAGRVVFVDFTADWCITCKMNKYTVLEQDDVIAAVDRLDVAMFIADWTRRDDRIRQKLAEFGKAGVPMYLVYSPHRPDSPRVLPEILTQNLLIEALEQAATP